MALLFYRSTCFRRDDGLFFDASAAAADASGARFLLPAFLAVYSESPPRHTSGSSPANASRGLFPSLFVLLLLLLVVVVVLVVEL